MIVPGAAKQVVKAPVALVLTVPTATLSTAMVTDSWPRKPLPRMQRRSPIWADARSSDSRGRKTAASFLMSRAVSLASVTISLMIVTGVDVAPGRPRRATPVGYAVAVG